MPPVSVQYQDGSILDNTTDATRIAAALKGGGRLLDYGVQLVGDGIRVDPDDWIIYTSRYSSTGQIPLRKFLAMPVAPIAPPLPFELPPELPPIAPPELPPIPWVPPLIEENLGGPGDVEIPPVFINPLAPILNFPTGLEDPFEYAPPLLQFPAPKWTVTADPAGHLEPVRVVVNGKGRLVYDDDELITALENGGHFEADTYGPPRDVISAPVVTAFDRTWVEFLERVATLEAKQPLYAEDVAAALQWAKQFAAAFPTQAPSMVAEKIGDWSYLLDADLLPRAGSLTGGPQLSTGAGAPAATSFLPWLGLGLGLLLLGRRKS